MDAGNRLGRDSTYVIRIKAVQIKGEKRIESQSERLLGNLVLALFSGEVAELTLQRENVEGMARLGNPLAFLSHRGDFLRHCYDHKCGKDLIVTEHEWLAEQFEEKRGHLRAVAYRMLGSLGEAEDAVQEAWIRLSRSDASSIENLGGWLTTVVAHVCLDMLRSRTSRREETMGERAPEPASKAAARINPEQEALLADSVGLALLVVLDRLAPAERLAFVLHDMFDLPFEEIASVIGRSPDATRQLASRARRRVRGANVTGSELSQQREVVETFLTALRNGDFEGLIAVLDPDVAVRLDEAAVRPGAPREVRGAQNWAKGAIAFPQFARFMQPMLINGAVGLAWAPNGRLSRVLRMTIVGAKIIAAEVIADPERLRELDLAVLGQSKPEKP